MTRLVTLRWSSAAWSAVLTLTSGQFTNESPSTRMSRWCSETGSARHWSSLRMNACSSRNGSAMSARLWRQTHPSPTRPRATTTQGIARASSGRAPVSELEVDEASRVCTEEPHHDDDRAVDRPLHEARDAEPDHVQVL